MNKIGLNQKLKKIHEGLLMDLMVFRSQSQLRMKITLISWSGIERGEL